MARKFLTPIDLGQHELQQAVIANLSSAPSSPVEGQIYHNSTSHIVFYWDGSAWVSASGIPTSYLDTDVTLAANSDAKLATQKATKAYADTKVASVTAGDSTITAAGTATNPTVKVAKTLDHTWVTDFDAQVRTSTLNQMTAPTADLSINSHKLTNVTDPTSAQDAATKAYVDGVAQGVTWKKSVVNATTAALPTYNHAGTGVGATLTKSTNGAFPAIDGITNALLDRILIKDEAGGNAKYNGIYTLTQLGDGSNPWILTRATDFDANAEIGGTAVLVESGTVNISQGWIVSSEGPYTIETTAIAFTQFTGLADITPGTGLAKTGNTLSLSPTPTYKYSSAANPASTTWTVTHSLATTAIVAMLRTTSSGQVVEADMVVTDANTLTITFAVAPTANSLTIVVIG